MSRRDDPRLHEAAWRSSRSDCTDLEKLEALGLLERSCRTTDEPDIFDGFFHDHTIDIQTGELLGRYIAEERDSGRMIAACRAS